MIINSKYPKAISRKEMLRFVTNKPATSLEVGCREAFFSKELKQQLNVKECWGIEPENNQEMIDQAKINLDHFINDFLTIETKLPEKHFDLIIFNDVLEHLYDPWEILLVCKKLLTKNGIIVASIPNIRHKSILKKLIFNDEFVYTQEGILDITHIRFFTKKTMEKLFTDCGYEVINIEPIFPKKKKITSGFFNFITRNRFKTLTVRQFGITAKIKS